MLYAMGIKEAKKRKRRGGFKDTCFSCGFSLLFGGKSAFDVWTTHMY